MNSRRLSIVGIIALLFVVGCSTTLTPTATPAPPQALATATVPTHAPTAAPSRPVGLAMDLDTEGLINLSDKPVTLDSNWWMKPYDTWRIKVRATFTQGSGVGGATEARYVGLATADGDLAFGFGFDLGRLSLLEPNNNPTSTGVMSKWDVSPYDLNIPYDMTMAVCGDSTGEYAVSPEFKRAGISVASSADASTFKISPTTEPLTRLIADVGSSGSVRFGRIEIHRVSTDASSCLAA